ncbi:DUF6448 family protein [Brevibacillus sp. SYSU BS000544]|uniref:DUF6448 family protein n=1 Tax=Brevibacillus sp. SYSU BS000544 TaxID=3416443 RepID=UPI003CE4BFD3
MKLPTNSKKFGKWALLSLPAVVLTAALLLPEGKASAHCDAVDGPVVTAAKKALDTGNVNYALPFVFKDGEGEVKAAFEKTMKARKEGPQVKELVDNWFYETVVRVHRLGEGADFTGLKPAGMDYGPALEAAEQAITKGSTDHVKELLLQTLEKEIDHRFMEVMEKRKLASLNDVDASREYAEASLLFQKYIYQIYSDATAAPAHGEGGEGEKSNHADAAPVQNSHGH